MHGKDAVLIVGEISELIDVFPHALVRGVEQVRSVLVHLDAGLRLRLGVGVAAQVVTALDDEHLLTQLRGRTFCNGQAEESGSNNDEVIRSHVPHLIGDRPCRRG